VKHYGPPARAFARSLVAAAALAACADTPAIPAGQEGCITHACHERVEFIHYGGDALSCVDCHGGNPAALTKEAAHPTTTISFNPSSPGGQAEGGLILRGASLQELDELDPDVLQFLNPADYRVVNNTCGSATRGGGNCHTRIARNSVLSTHATLSGQIAGGLYFGGLTDRAARFSVIDTVDPFATSAPGFVDAVSILPGDVSEMGIPQPDPVAAGYFATLGQQCVECHLVRDGGALPGKYTSSGCNACHMLTADDGRPETTDPTQDRDEMGHPIRHRLTNLVSDAQCNRCHHAHLQRGLLFQGIRERSEPDGDLALGGPNRGEPDPPNIRYWSADHYVRESGGYFIYDKPYPFYIEDEDTTNDVDETPPDIHFEKGMACIDCHTMGEVHGSEHLAERREFETKVRCETCHGLPEGPIDPTRTAFQVALSRVGGTADNKPVMTVDGDGKIFQLGKFDGVEHPVTQINHRLDPGDAKFNRRTLMGCGLHSGNAAFRAQLLALFAATDPTQVDEEFPGMPEGSTLAADLGDRDGRVECYACHNAWTENCFGCHVSRDDRVMVRNQVTGEMQPGKISNFAMSVVPDALTLGFDTRGRVSPMVGTAIFFTHIDASGNKLVDAAPLRTVDGFSGSGNQHNPVHHHTVRRQPRDCTGCHPRADSIPDDQDALKRAIGFGTGRYQFQDGTGKKHVLDSLVGIDFDDDGVYDDPTVTPLGTRAYLVEPRAASTHLRLPGATIGPGPLDMETINRMLQNRVVPQRPP